MKKKRFVFPSAGFKCHRIDGIPVIAGVVCVSLAGLLSRFLSGSPLPVLHIIGMKQALPPTWVFFLIWLFSYLVLGFCFGAVLGSRALGKEVNKYKGSFFFTVMIVFNIVWYPLFFKAGAFFFALIDILFIILFCFLTAVQYMKVNKIFGICMFIHMIWLLYCFILNFTAFIKT